MVLFLHKSYFVFVSRSSNNYSNLKKKIVLPPAVTRSSGAFLETAINLEASLCQSLQRLHNVSALRQVFVCYYSMAKGMGLFRLGI